MTTPTTLQHYLIQLGEIRQWNFDQAVGDDLIDVILGVDGDADLTAEGSGGTSVVGPSPFADENLAIDLDATRYYRDIAGSAEITLPSGCIFATFKMNSGWGSGTHTILAYGNTGGAITLRLEIIGRKVHVKTTDVGSKSSSWLETTTTLSSSDTSWHSVLAVQPGDGSGVTIYLDGVALSISSTYQNGHDADTWFDDISPQALCNHTVGGTTNTVVQSPFDGTLDLICITGGAAAATADFARKMHQAVFGQSSLYSAINPTAPVHWWRFSDPSQDIRDQGFASSQIHLEPEDAEGTINVSYREEANPPADGYGVRFEGQGGFSGTSLAMAGSTGTLFVSFRTDGTVVNGDRLLTLYAGTSIAVAIGIDSTTGYPHYRIQDAGGDSHLWEHETDISDDLVHTIAVSPALTSTGTPAVYVDGLSVSSGLVLTESGDVDHDFWWDEFVELLAIGYRGSPTGLPMSGIVMYDALIFDTALSLGQVSTVHNALTTQSVAPPDFSLKPVRVTGRRLVFDHWA